MGLIDARSRADLTRRLLVTAAALLTYCAGTHVPLPGFDPQVLAHIEGMAVARISIFALGAVPFISALGLVEIAKVVAPSLRQWERSKAANQVRLTRIVIGLALLFAAVQASGIALALEDVAGLVPEPGLAFRLMCIGTLVTGAALVIWLAGQIARHGLGSGAWLLFLTPMLADFPNRVAALAAWQGDGGLIGLELMIGGIFAVLIMAAVTTLMLAGNAVVTGATCLWSVLLARVIIVPVLLLVATVPAWNSPAQQPSGNLGFASTVLAMAIIVTAVAPLYARSLRLGGIDGPGRAFAAMIGATLSALTVANLAVQAIVAQLMPLSGQLIILAVVALSILLPWWQPATASAKPAILDEAEAAGPQSSGGNR